tara:strand:- start:8406 stop:8612 length:207 start_codon:yes stop_codon:yes gene_type:complete
MATINVDLSVDEWKHVQLHREVKVQEEYKLKAKNWDKLLQAISKDHNLDFNKPDVDIWHFLKWSKVLK